MLVMVRNKRDTTTYMIRVVWQSFHPKLFPRLPEMMMKKYVISFGSQECAIPVKGCQPHKGKLSVYQVISRIPID